MGDGRASQCEGGGRQQLSGLYECMGEERGALYEANTDMCCWGISQSIWKALGRRGTVATGAGVHAACRCVCTWSMAGQSDMRTHIELAHSKFGRFLASSSCAVTRWRSVHETGGRSLFVKETVIIAASRTLTMVQARQGVIAEGMRLEKEAAELHRLHQEILEVTQAVVEGRRCLSQ